MSRTLSKRRKLDLCTISVCMYVYEVICISASVYTCTHVCVCMCPSRIFAKTPGMYVYIHLCIYIYVHVHGCVSCVRMYVRVCACVRAYVCASMCACERACLCACALADVIREWESMCACMRVCVYTRTRIHARTRMYFWCWLCTYTEPAGTCICMQYTCGYLREIWERLVLELVEGNESCDTHELIMSHMRMRHVKHMNRQIAAVSWDWRSWSVWIR